MSTITFDTHEFFKELKSAGFSEQQAEAITKLQKAAAASTLEQARTEYDLDNVATKRDIDDLHRDMDARLIKMEQRDLALISRTLN
jgi:hypothetical protein